jgi:hypothetical protein
MAMQFIIATSSAVKKAARGQTAGSGGPFKSTYIPATVENPGGGCGKVPSEVSAAAAAGAAGGGGGGGGGEAGVVGADGVVDEALHAALRRRAALAGEEPGAEHLARSEEFLLPARAMKSPMTVPVRPSLAVQRQCQRRGFVEAEPSSSCRSALSGLSQWLYLSRSMPSGPKSTNPRFSAIKIHFKPSCMIKSKLWKPGETS